MAKEKRDTLFVGVEYYGEGLRKITRTVKETGISNIVPLCGDGYVILKVVFANDSLDGIFVNFPDPWPKKRHEKKRLFTKEFFSLCAMKLKKGGKLNLATDDKDLAGQAIEEIKSVDRLELLSHLERSPHPFQTRYEKKWMSEGRELSYFTYEKKPCLT